MADDATPSPARPTIEVEGDGFVVRISGAAIATLVNDRLVPEQIPGLYRLTDGVAFAPALAAALVADADGGGSRFDWVLVEAFNDAMLADAPGVEDLGFPGEGAR